MRIRDRNQVDKEAREKVEILMEQMAEQWGVTEELKRQEPVSYTHLDVYKRQVKNLL